MDYPYGGHRHHHHHHGRREDEEDYLPPPRQPPPPFYGMNEPPPPFPPPLQVYMPEPYPPPPPHFSIYPPPPSLTVDHHPHHHHHVTHAPPGIHHHSHHVFDELSDRPTVKMYCKADPNYSLAVRDGKVILSRSDPSDPFQHWIKEEKFSTRVKDEEGFPSFALVNKATRFAMKHSIGATHPVQLIPYNPNYLDESILWSESRDTGEGYRAIRMVNNIRLNVDAFHGDRHYGGIHDGSIIVLWEWKKGDNQRWKIVPNCKSFGIMKIPCCFFHIDS